MEIRFAEKNDIPDIERLLRQICTVHSVGRPDLFRENGQKYNAQQIEEMIRDESCPLIVASEDNRVVGYAMCVVTTVKNDTALCDNKTLYLDDLCVDREKRGNGIGRKIYDFVVDHARQLGCDDLTLNVWECNTDARRFYDRLGLKIRKTTLEKLLK